MCQKTRKISIDGNVYPDGFYNDNVIAYHLVTMIMQSLGFDMLHFSAFPGEMFVASKEDAIRFIRHHFRAIEAWIRKQSMWTEDVNSKM